MINNPLPRLDVDSAVRQRLLAYCRLAPGDMWVDPCGQHRVVCGDASNLDHIATLMQHDLATLAIHDPPYNLVTFEMRTSNEFVNWCQKWIELTAKCLKENAALYVWLGADQSAHFQPLPQFMLMMERIEAFKSRSLITLRNQRGYGTQNNWMAVRQELLYYTKGKPLFEVQYTDIPKVLKGYYKKVGGVFMENVQRSKSVNIRPGNVWIDIQQVFYRMEENVSGCFAQKPLKALQRIVAASSRPGDVVLDFFAHSGSTLMTCELMQRRCLTVELDPLFCEITIRRLEHFRATGRTGWQNGHAFELELAAVENASQGAK